MEAAQQQITGASGAPVLVKVSVAPSVALLTSGLTYCRA